MNSPLSGTRLDGAAGFSATGSRETGKAATGEWNGLVVTVSDDPASLLADAAEELTFAASETVEKKVADRKKSEKERPLSTVKPPEEILQKLHKRNEEKLAKLLAAARAAGGNPALFREAVDAFSADPTERHAALLWLQDELAAEPELAAMAARERESLESTDAAAVRAGYNIDDVATDGVRDRDDGRALYRLTILGHADVGAMLTDILEREGEGDFSGTVAYLQKAVGADLSAATPSIDTRELEALNNDLYHLRAIANFTKEFDDALTKIREKTGQQPIPDAGRKTLALLCRMKEQRLVMLDGLNTILALRGDRDPTHDVLVLGLTRNLVHRLPAKLFSDEESRQRLLAAQQKLLDAAIELEESLAGEE